MEGVRAPARTVGGGAGGGGGLERNACPAIDQAASTQTIATAKSLASTKRCAGEIPDKSIAALKRCRTPENETKSCVFTMEKSAGQMKETATISLRGGQKVEKECTMCGDVGFEDDLLLCKRCGYRFQHTYCSKLYPDLDMESWACEWCLYEDEKNGGGAKGKLGKRKVLNLTESRSKAFEFLLQIAQACPSERESYSDRRQKANGEISVKRQRENGDDRRVNGIANKKENGFKCSNGNSNARVEQKQVVRCGKEENPLKLGQLGEHWNPNGNCKEENGLKSGGQQVPKKQRCSHATDKNKALDRWRNIAKNKLHCNASKAIGRRYKLLADVLC